MLSAKLCSKCQNLKEAEAFYPRPKSKSGLTSWCRECIYTRSLRDRPYTYEQQRQYRTINKDKIRAKRKKDYHANRDQNLAKSKAWFHAHPETKRRSALKKHGLTVELFEDMLQAQNNVCKLCKGPFEAGKFLGPYVDHDHATGQLRAILHGRCNIGIGVFGDDPAKLRSAAEYLESYKCTQ